MYIIESLDLENEDRRKEGEILSKTLALSGKRPIYRYVRTKNELIYFIKDFRKHNYRYLHLSCHGNVDLIALTMEQLDNKEFAKLTGPSLEKRRLFLSSCLATTKDLAKAIFSHGGCLSVAGPIKKIYFDDSAIFWSSFYHLMFKQEQGSMRNADIAAKMMILGWALGKQFHLFTPSDDGAVGRILPPRELLKTRLESLLADVKPAKSPDRRGKREATSGSPRTKVRS